MTNLRITERRVGDVTILDLDGEVRIDGGSVVLQKAIRSLLEGGRNLVLLNLAGVAYIDSSGLGELIAGHVSLDKSGGRIKLLHLTRRLRELMVITKLLTVFDVFEDESEALASFVSPALNLVEYRSTPLEGTQHEKHP